MFRPSPRLRTIRPQVKPRVFVILWPGRYDILTTMISSLICFTFHWYWSVHHKKDRLCAEKKRGCPKLHGNFPEEVCPGYGHCDRKPGNHHDTDERVDLRGPGQAVPDPLYPIRERVDKGDRLKPCRQGADGEECAREPEEGKDDKVHDQLEAGHILHPRGNCYPKRGKRDPDKDHETEGDKETCRVFDPQAKEHGKHHEDDSLNHRSGRAPDSHAEHDLDPCDRCNECLFQKPE